MDLQIKGLRVLVTAGANGIGRATARAFAAEGAKVHICDVDHTALAESNRILVQVMTIDRPYGFRVKGGGKDGIIASTGGAPLGVERIDADLQLRIPGPWTAIALDPNGYAIPTPVRMKGGRSGEPLTIRLPADTPYTVLTR